MFNLPHQTWVLWVLPYRGEGDVLEKKVNRYFSAEINVQADTSSNRRLPSPFITEARSVSVPGPVPLGKLSWKYLWHWFYNSGHNSKSGLVTSNKLICLWQAGWEFSPIWGRSRLVQCWCQAADTPMHITELLLKGKKHHKNCEKALTSIRKMDWGKQ